MTKTMLSSRALGTADKEHTIAPERIVAWSVAGITVSIGLFGGIVAWASTAKIDGAVIAPAIVSVESQRKNVQHLEGGIVAEVLVRDGDAVKAGQPVILLDSTAVTSELATVTDRLAGLQARQARLLAELNGAESVLFPNPVSTRLDEPKIAAILNNEQRLFASRKASRKANVELMHRRIASLTARRQGQFRQKASSEKERVLLDGQLADLERLEKRKLVQTVRVLEVRRSITRLEASMSGSQSEIESLKAQIDEIEAELREAAATFRSATAEEVARIQSEIHVLDEQAIVLQDRLTRQVIVAPQDGRVLNLGVNVKGAVIAPGVVAMEIVPVDDDLILTAQIPAAEIERVHTGQLAKVRLTAFNQATTPELDAVIESISADVLTDPETGQPFYAAKMKLSGENAWTVNGQELVPGMPAETLISTGERLASSYLLRPVRDAYARTFRDE